MNIVVTGAGSGIGAALTKALAGEGHRLFICGRRYEKLCQTFRDSGDVRFSTCDVSDRKRVAELFESVADRFARLDAVIHCACILGEIGPVAATGPEKWLDTIKNNLFGAYLIARYSIPLLQKADHPVFIGFSGGGAFEPFPNYSAYACSKAAIVRLNECLAEELKEKGIRVVTVAPGPQATEMHQATLAAGEAKAGKAQYDKVQAILSDQNSESRMKRAVDCVRWILSNSTAPLSGRTIAAQFDPWDAEGFETALDSLPDLYMMRRVNLHKDASNRFGVVGGNTFTKMEAK